MLSKYSPPDRMPSAKGPCLRGRWVARCGMQGGNTGERYLGCKGCGAISESTCVCVCVNPSQGAEKVAPCG